MFGRQNVGDVLYTTISAVPLTYATFFWQLSLLDCLDREDGGDELIQNVNSYLLISTASYAKRPESS